ncbi:MAG: TRAM domain-containing protein, partial [Bacteroidota bacterium]
FYSERPGTLAAKKYQDDIPLETKKKRLQEIIDRQRAHSIDRNRMDVGKTFSVLVEGKSKRSEERMQGRNSANKVIIFEGDIPKGTYVDVKVTDYTAATLFGELV